MQNEVGLSDYGSFPDITVHQSIEPAEWDPQAAAGCAIGGARWRDGRYRTYGARGHRDFDIPGLPAWGDAWTIGPPGLDDTIDRADSDVSIGLSLEMRFSHNSFARMFTKHLIARTNRTAYLI
jgi:hypothetical protein